MSRLSLPLYLLEMWVEKASAVAFGNPWASAVTCGVFADGGALIELRYHDEVLCTNGQLRPNLFDLQGARGAVTAELSGLFP